MALMPIAAIAATPLTLPVVGVGVVRRIELRGVGVRVDD